MSVNNIQVGGSHYKSNGVQHWDYCVETNVPNLEYAASKYVQRHASKNGRQDLEKAIHYLEKRIESYRNHTGVFKAANRKDGLFNRYIKDNNIDGFTRVTIDTIMHWRRIEQLEDAILNIQKMIEEAYDGAPTAGYVNQDR